MPVTTCGDCRYYKEIKDGKGVCRKAAPCPVDPRHNGTVTQWPKVNSTDCCGDHQPKIP
jgi:hypothetical protein